MLVLHGGGATTGADAIAAAAIHTSIIDIIRTIELNAFIVDTIQKVYIRITVYFTCRCSQIQFYTVLI